MRCTFEPPPAANRIARSEPRGNAPGPGPERERTHRPRADTPPQQAALLRPSHHSRRPKQSNDYQGLAEIGA